MSKQVIIAPSILAADFSRLGEEIVDVVEAGADWIHLDVMDGHFVPNITIGPDVIRNLRTCTKAIFDAHLMISPCEDFLASFAKAGCDIITIHAEAGPHTHRSLQTIKALGKKAGVAINPSTSESVLEYLLDDIDLILVMSVNPGFGGQIFIGDMLKKIQKVRSLIDQRPIDLEVDGGLSVANIGEVAEAGANVFVAGSAVFKDGNRHIYEERIGVLRAAAHIKDSK